MEVFPGLQAGDGGRRVGTEAAAVMHLPCLQHCHIEHRTDAFHRSLRTFHRLVSERSHGRTGLTSIGQQIQRTPLSDQTSPRRSSGRTASEKRKITRHVAFKISQKEKKQCSKRVLFCCCCYNPCGSSGSFRRPQPELRPLQRGKQPLTKLPSAALDLSKVGQTTLPPDENYSKEQVETLSCVSNSPQSCVNPCS